MPTFSNVGSPTLKDFTTKLTDVKVRLEVPSEIAGEGAFPTRLEIDRMDALPQSRAPFAGTTAVAER